MTDSIEPERERTELDENVAAIALELRSQVEAAERSLDLGKTPIDGSIGFRERQGDTELARQLEAAHDSAYLIIRSTGEHVLCALDQLEQGSTMTPFSVARTALEGCALAAWLAAPSCSAQERVRRLFAQRLRAYKEQVNLYRNMELEPARFEVMLQETRLKGIQLLEIAESLSIPTNLVQVRGHGKMMPDLEQKLERWTVLAQTVLDREFAYRAFSGISHNRPDAMLTMCFPYDSEYIDERGERRYWVTRELASEVKYFILSQISPAYLRALNAWRIITGEHHHTRHLTSPLEQLLRLDSKQIEHVHWIGDRL